MHLQRLRQVLETRERISAHELATLIRAAGREDATGLGALDVDPLLFGLQQAFLDGDAESLAFVAGVGATALDARGEHEQAIACLEQAYSMVGADSDVSGTLTAQVVLYEAMGGHLAGARRWLTTVEDAAPGELAEGPPLAFSRAVVGSVLLSPGSELALLRDVIDENRLRHADAVASSAMVYLTAAAAARGEVVEAERVAEELLAYATEVGHRARQVDAEVALLALQSRRGETEAPEGLADEAVQLMNNHALWKLLVPRYRQQVLRGDVEAAEETHDLLVANREWVNPGYRNSFEGLEAYAAVLFEPLERVELPLPETPTLISVDNVLASAEAVALGGSLSEAADWLAFLEEELPAHVVTSLEWPASRERVEGLLLLRATQREAALARLSTAVEHCLARGDVIEAEIARAQLAVLTDDEAACALARERLSDVGIDARWFEDAALRVDERAGRARAELSLVEARALGRMARGMSYREIEADLGLPERRASSLLSRCYKGLGVRGRVQAAAVAREQLIT